MSGQTPLAFSACKSGQALGESGFATTTRVCAFSYGKEADQLSRLNYYGYRYYDPLSLQWTQADPLYRVAPDIAYDSPREISLYTFSLNNPVRYMDPDGRMPLLALPAVAPVVVPAVSTVASYVGVAIVAAAAAIGIQELGLPAMPYLGGNKFAGPGVQAEMRYAKAVMARRAEAKEYWAGVQAQMDGMMAEATDTTNDTTGSTTTTPTKKTKKERRARQRAEANEQKHGDADYEEPASEDYVRHRAKELEKTKGKEGRREAHDAKEPGEPDRSKSTVKEDYQ